MHEDWRTKNPALHMLYVKTATQHLTSIDKTIRRFSRYSNLNMLDVICALENERKKLIEENTAYADADEILQLIAKAR